MDLIVELSFAGFSWSAFGATVTNMNNDIYVWIKGFFLLFGWLLLLIPLRSYSPVYKLISVLKHITITDMFPWILLYITISSGFASAIQLQFQLLPGNVTCLEEEHDLQEVLHHAGNALFELVIMTTGLDTDLKHVRNIACLFEHNQRSVHIILLLVTIYAVLSAVVLLNMLIAIMSNTVTEAQQSKGWKQYQVHQAVRLHDFIHWIKRKVFSCSGQQENTNQSNYLHQEDKPFFLDELIRRSPFSKKGKVKQDKETNRWYLTLEDAELKAIRAVIWQQSRE